MAALAEADIPVILLKGADLAQTLYPNPALRPMGDLDLLVHKEDLDRAVDLAFQMGYQEAVDSDPGVNRQFGHHIHLRNEKHVILELHWGLVGGEYDQRSPPMAWVWSQVHQPEFQELDKRQFQMLDAPAHILFICAHMALQHGLSEARLIWFYDVYLLLQSYGDRMIWNKLLSGARQSGWGASLDAMLSAVVSNFEYPVPQDFISKLRRTPSNDEKLVQREIDVTRTMHGLHVFSALEASHKAKYLFVRLFPSPTHMRNHYHPKPSWIWPLYYPYRWWDMAVDLLRTILRKNN